MSFKDIKGQERPIQIIKEHIKRSHLAGSYLFIGPEGAGKKMVAKAIAQALNCQNLSFDSCPGCISCLKIERNQHPDIHLINYADSEAIKIEDIRQLRNDINLLPFEAKFKVFIIDNAHNLTAEAENALLKILEEPPKDSVIILVTAKPQLLFKTIISRCQVLKFYSLSITTLQELLKKDYNLESNLAHFLAYFCEGRLGPALRLKDIDILREKNAVIDQFVFLRNSNLMKFSIQNRDELKGHLNILASWFRDLYLIKIGWPHNGLINLDRKTELLKIMHQFSFVDLDEIIRTISDSLWYLGQNVNIKLLLANLKQSISPYYLSSKMCTSSTL